MKKRKGSFLIAVLLICCITFFVTCKSDFAESENNLPEESISQPSITQPEEPPVEEIVPDPNYFTPGLAFYHINNQTAFEVYKGEAEILDSVVIPPSYNGLPVVSIGNYAFSDCKNLKSITLPNSITNIGGAAFKGSGLVELQLPESVVEIGAQAFSSCSDLVSVTIPASVTSIGQDAFALCEALENLDVSENNTVYKSEGSSLIQTDTNTLIFSAEPNTIPEGVESIAPRAFYNNTSITEVKIPASVKQIGAEAFAGCSMLTKLEFEQNSNLQTIGERAFAHCISLTNISAFPSALQNIEAEAFISCTSLTSVTIPKNVTRLGAEAFSYCASLKTVSIAAALEELPAGIFSDTIESLSISNVKVIGNNAFRGYKKLKTVSILAYDQAGLSVEQIAPYAFYECTGLETLTIYLLGPNNFQSIGANAFAYCTSLKTVDIQYKEADNFKTIGEKAFYGCQSLTDFQIKQANTTKNYLLSSIGNQAFGECKNLKITTLPDAEEMGDYIFTDNTTITSIRIPYTVKKLGDNAFANCTSLTKIEFSLASQIEIVGDNAFFNCVSLRVIEDFPISIKHIGKSAFQGCLSLESFVIAKGVTSIGAEAFYNTPNLKKVEMRASLDVLPRGIFQDTIVELTIANSRVIGETAFKGFSALEKLTFTYDPDPNNQEIISRLEVISYQAFYGCKNLRSVVFDLKGDNRFQSIGSMSFAACISLNTVDMFFTQARYFKKIEERAFYACVNLREFRVDPMGECQEGYVLDIIEEDAFGDCFRLTSYNLPNTKEIGARAYTQSGFVALVLPKDLVTIGELAFAYSSTLEVVTFAKGNQISSISAKSFDRCPAIREISLPEAVEKLEPYAFYQMPMLEYIFVPNNSKLREIGDYAFAGSPNFKRIRYEVGPEERKLEYIGKGAFQDCVSLEGATASPNLTYIGDYAYAGCRNMTDLYIENGLQYLGDYAFLDCERLEGSNGYLTIPQSITTLGTSVFENCRTLTRVVLPEEMEVIGKRAFANCMSLITINIPETIYNLEERAFSGCANLSISFFPEGIPYDLLDRMGDEVFYNCDKAILYLTMTPQLGKFNKNVFTGSRKLQVTIAADVEVIPEWFFYGLTGMSKLTFAPGSKIHTIEHSSFGYTERLASVHYYSNEASGLKEGFPQSLKIIAEAAFYHSGFVKLYFHKNIEQFGREAFGYNKNLVKAEFDLYSNDSKLKYFDDTTFRECTALEEFWVPQSVTYIKTLYFTNFKNLKRVYLSGRIQEVDDMAFYGLTNLLAVDFGMYTIEGGYLRSDLVNIGARAFYGCENLFSSPNSTVLMLPTSLKSIGAEAFYGCKSLDFIDFMVETYSKLADLESIGDRAFYGCSKLRLMTLGRTRLKTIGKSAFAYCTTMQSLPIPKTVEAIGQNAFEGWGPQQQITIDGGIEQFNLFEGTMPFWRDKCNAIFDTNGVNV